MSLIRRFFGDDQNLKAANLESAPRLTLDLSGTQLTIPRPRQSVIMPGGGNEQNLMSIRKSLIFLVITGFLLKKFMSTDGSFGGNKRDQSDTYYLKHFWSILIFFQLSSHYLIKII